MIPPDQTIDIAAHQDGILLMNALLYVVWGASMCWSVDPQFADRGFNFRSIPWGAFDKEGDRP